MHNKLNLRDTSTEPTNIYGDRNLARTDQDLNDREDDDQPPPLENVRLLS